MMNYVDFIDSLVTRLYVDEDELANIQDQLYRLQAGLAGEERLRFTLSDYSFKQPAKLLYDFQCMNNRGFSHQMDALVVTPHFVLIIEAKHLSGTLSYKPSVHEFSRTSQDGVVTNFRNPFDQAFRHQLFLEHYFASCGIQIPVKYVVINTNLHAKLDPSLFNFPILHVTGLPLLLENMQQQYTKRYANLQTICDALQKISCYLPRKPIVTRDKIRKGVFCRNCQLKEIMHYERGYWICSQCCTRDKKAVLLALQHYRMLIDYKITNREFREFVGISNFDIASKLLLRLGLNKIGKNRGAYYIIPVDIFKKSFI